VHGAPYGAPKYAWGAPLREIPSDTSTALMRGATEKEIIPRLELLVNKMQQQKAIKYHFLDFVFLCNISVLKLKTRT